VLPVRIRAATVYNDRISLQLARHLPSHLINLCIRLLAFIFR
jgi:hypothetical protein